MRKRGREQSRARENVYTLININLCAGPRVQQHNEQSEQMQAMVRILTPITS